MKISLSGTTLVVSCVPLLRGVFLRISNERKWVKMFSGILRGMSFTFECRGWQHCPKAVAGGDVRRDEEWRDRNGDY